MQSVTTSQPMSCYSPIPGIDPRGGLGVMVDVIDLAIIIRGHVPTIWQRVSCAVTPAQQDSHATRASCQSWMRWRWQGQRWLWMSSVAGPGIDAGTAIREIGTFRTARRTDLIEFLWHSVAYTSHTLISSELLALALFHRNDYHHHHLILIRIRRPTPTITIIIYYYYYLPHSFLRERGRRSTVLLV